MKYPALISMTALTAGIAMFALTAAAQAPKAAPSTAPKGAPARTWAAPKTPWGDPDLQGTWTSDDCIGTGLNRAANLGEKRYWTEQELAQRESTLARQLENDKEEFVADNSRVGTGPPGHWGERARRPCK